MLSDAQQSGVKIDGKTVMCIECANFGKPNGCEVCHRRKSKNRQQFEREQGYKIWWASLTKAQQIEIKNKRREVVQLAAEAEASSDRTEAVADFLKRIWDGLNKFQMVSCGIPELDERVRQAYGDW